MSASAEKLESLKTQLRALGGFHEKEYLQSREVSIPRGAITQVVGPGKTECVAEFLAQNPQLQVAWIESRLSINPMGFMQRNLSLQRFLFIEAKSNFVWATLQTLSSGLFDVVVMSFSPLEQKNSNLNDLRVMRRFQLLAEKSRGSLFFLSNQTLESWPIALHLEAFRDADSYKWRNVRGHA